jgi:hypothetical protein
MIADKYISYLQDTNIKDAEKIEKSFGHPKIGDLVLWDAPRSETKVATFLGYINPDGFNYRCSYLFEDSDTIDSLVSHAKSNGGDKYHGYKYQAKLFCEKVVITSRAREIRSFSERKKIKRLQ